MKLNESEKETTNQPIENVTEATMCPNKAKLETSSQSVVSATKQVTTMHIHAISNKGSLHVWATN